MSNDKQQLHPVVLQRDHEHAGELKRASQTIHVSAATRDWLIANHVVAAPESDETKKGAKQ